MKVFPVWRSSSAVHCCRAAALLAACLAAAPAFEACDELPERSSPQTVSQLLPTRKYLFPTSRT